MRRMPDSSNHLRHGQQLMIECPEQRLTRVLVHVQASRPQPQLLPAQRRRNMAAKVRWMLCA